MALSQAAASWFSPALIIIILAHCVKSELICPTGQYFNVALESCTPCSVCSDGLVVKEICQGTRDTVCGPFVEFVDFLNGLESVTQSASTTDTNNVHWFMRNDVKGLNGPLIALVAVVWVIIVACSVVLILIVKRYRDNAAERQDKVTQCPDTYRELKSTCIDLHGNTYVPTTDKVNLITEVLPR